MLQMLLAISTCLEVDCMTRELLDCTHPHHVNCLKAHHRWCLHTGMQGAKS
jgi:hypothetical protein